jgi:hypothetical protein
MLPPGEVAKPAGLAPRGFGTTLRLDRWSLAPAITGLGFGVFVIYTSISAFLMLPDAFLHVPYEAQGYLSPYFSPLIVLPFLPAWFSPAILILWIPLGFRLTCYYYRKFYYRAYLFDPPACAVGEPSIHRRYSGETRFPFNVMNQHRLFLYLAFIPLFFLAYDALTSLRFDDQWRIGLGSVVLFTNVVLLAGFSFSCNSLRHVVGGGLDCFSCTARQRTRYSLWRRVTSLNVNHAGWAWASLISVMVADIYVRLLALGWIADPAITF